MSTVDILNKILTFILIINLFFLIRNSIIAYYQQFAIDLVYKHIKAIPYNEYEFGKDYYKEMLISYRKHMFSIWMWGKYSAIKPHYRAMLKKYEYLIK